MTNNKIISYDLNENKEYHEYKNEFKDNTFDIIIDNKEKIVNLIGRCKSNIQIWNFHTGEKINIININNEFYCESIISLKYQFYLISQIKKDGKNSTIKLVDLNNGKIVKELISFKNDNVRVIKKINHSIFGESFIVINTNKKIQLLLPEYN